MAITTPPKWSKRSLSPPNIDSASGREDPTQPLADYCQMTDRWRLRSKVHASQQISEARIGALVGHHRDHFDKSEFAIMVLERFFQLDDSRHLNVYRRRELRAHSAQAFAGRAFALVRLALDDEQVRATRLG